MRRFLALSATVLVASTMAMVTPSIAGGVSDQDTLAIDPSEGPPGTEIAVSGEGCVTKGVVVVEVVLLDTEGAEQDFTAVTPPGGGFGGEWEATLTVPADTTDFGEWTVDAVCIVEVVDDVALNAGLSPIIVDYTDRPFVVTEPAVQEPPPVDPPAPPAAAPVAAAPDFTG